MTPAQYWISGGRVGGGGGVLGRILLNASGAALARRGSCASLVVDHVETVVSDAVAMGEGVRVGEDQQLTAYRGRKARCGSEW